MTPYAASDSLCLRRIVGTNGLSSFAMRTEGMLRTHLQVNKEGRRKNFVLKLFGILSATLAWNGLSVRTLCYIL